MYCIQFNPMMNYNQNAIKKEVRRELFTVLTNLSSLEASVRQYYLFWHIHHIYRQIFISANSSF